MAVVAARQLSVACVRRGALACAANGVAWPSQRSCSLSLPRHSFLPARSDVAADGAGLRAELHLQSAPPRPKPPPGRQRTTGRCSCRPTEVDYDYNNQRVSAVGNVQMFYNGTSVEADKVIYDQKTKRLHAEGNIRLTDADGKITYANIMDLSDDYRDGFVNSLRVDTADQTRMAATRADRSSGNYTVFENGVYTACAPCKDDPKKPPLWQVKGARIIHDQTEKMLYFENAQLEFFGVPMAYMPYFSTPDPTVKRKTGFLMPGYTSTIDLRLRRRSPVSTGRSRPTTTRPSTRASPPGRACCCRPNSASA